MPDSQSVVINSATSMPSLLRHTLTRSSIVAAQRRTLPSPDWLWAHLSQFISESQDVQRKWSMRGSEIVHFIHRSSSRLGMIDPPCDRSIDLNWSEAIPLLRLCVCYSSSSWAMHVASTEPANAGWMKPVDELDVDVRWVDDSCRWMKRRLYMRRWTSNYRIFL